MILPVHYRHTQRNRFWIVFLAILLLLVGSRLLIVPEVPDSAAGLMVVRLGHPVSTLMREAYLGENLSPSGRPQPHQVM